MTSLTVGMHLLSYRTQWLHTMYDRLPCDELALLTTDIMTYPDLSLSWEVQASGRLWY